MYANVNFDAAPGAGWAPATSTSWKLRGVTSPFAAAMPAEMPARRRNPRRDTRASPEKNASRSS
jgi:hypothetical protein